MEWAKLSSQAWMDPRLRRVGPDAACLYLFSISYAAAVESDGFIDESAANLLSISRKWRSNISKLIDEHLWEYDDSKGGWWITNYLEYNLSHQDYAAQKAKKSAHAKKAASARWGSSHAQSIAPSNAPSNAQNMPRREENRIDTKETNVSLAEQGKCNITPHELIDGAVEPVASREPEATSDDLTPSVLSPKANRTRQPRSTTRGATSGVQRRKRDPLFDAMAVACGHDLDNLTKSEGTAIGSAVAEIRNHPGISPQVIREKAQAYRSLHPDWELTPRALVKHWSALAERTVVAPRYRGLNSVCTDFNLSSGFTEELLRTVGIAPEARPNQGLPPAFSTPPLGLDPPDQGQRYDRTLPAIAHRRPERATASETDGDLPLPPPRRVLSEDDFG